MIQCSSVYINKLIALVCNKQQVKPLPGDVSLSSSLVLLNPLALDDLCRPNEVGVVSPPILNSLPTAYSACTNSSGVPIYIHIYVSSG